MDRLLLSSRPGSEDIGTGWSDAIAGIRSHTAIAYTFAADYGR